MKLFYFKDNNKKINYFNSDEQVIIPDKYYEKNIRGFWVSNVLNIDLPIMIDENQYKNELDNIIKTAKEYNLNNIFFQVRPLNDAFYKSKLNPYSRFLTGEEGVEPKFDVLKYLIDNSKKEGIKIHAWCNPYRVSMPLKEVSKNDYLEKLDNLNFAKKFPKLVISDVNNQLILNPAKEDVKNFIIESMVEIIKNYEVAGIHFDDYFYPYADLKEDDNDLIDFKNRENKSINLEDFRREHINDVIKRTYQAIKNENPKMVFGVSPFGIWKTNNTDILGA